MAVLRKALWRGDLTLARWKSVGTRLGNHKIETKNRMERSKVPVECTLPGIHTVLLPILCLAAKLNDMNSSKTLSSICLQVFARAVSATWAALHSFYKCTSCSRLINRL